MDEHIFDPVVVAMQNLIAEVIKVADSNDISRNLLFNLVVKFLYLITLKEY